MVDVVGGFGDRASITEWVLYLAYMFVRASKVCAVYVLIFVIQGLGLLTFPLFLPVHSSVHPHFRYALPTLYF